MPVAELKDQTRLGKVSEVVIDNEKLSVAALVLQQPNLFFLKNKFILAIDIVYLLKNGLIIKDDESLVDQNESVNVDRLVKEKCFGIGQKVITDSGEYLGHVYDFMIESETLSITRLLIKKMMQDRIIQTDKVITMTGKIITVKDNYAGVRIRAIPATETVSV
jgi:sporulation protein YlmC with PRC-barrel domain